MQCMSIEYDLCTEFHFHTSYLQSLVKDETILQSLPLHYQLTKQFLMLHCFFPEELFSLISIHAF